MGDQLTTNAEALRLFFTEELFLVADEVQQIASIESAGLPGLPEVQHEAKPEEQHEVKSAAPRAFKYLGKNRKNVLILVNDPENEVSTDRGRELLRNLVKALQLTANDFALLNYAAHPQVGFNALQEFFSTKLVLSFGVSPAHLGMNEFPQHKLATHGSSQVVFTGNLDLLCVDQEGKKILWGSLKQISL